MLPIKILVVGLLNMSELLNKQLNCVIGLRKINSLQIEEINQNELELVSIRPQLHCLPVKPFGHIKSTYSEAFAKVLGYDLVREDDFTKASFMGTISKNGSYVPGLIGSLGGKVLLIDEFNNLNFETYKALLGALENQRVDRSLGFAVKKPISIKNEWTNLQVKEGRISGKVYFSCIAFAMEFPKTKKSMFQDASEQSLVALKSRFSPNFSVSSHQTLMDSLRGYKPFELVDVAKTSVRKVLIKQQAYAEFMDYFEEASKEICGEEGEGNLLTPKTFGFLSRTQNDLLRFSVFDMLKELPKNYTNELLEITNSVLLIENAKLWLMPILNQYVHEEKAGNYDAFLKLRLRKPNATQRFYAQQLNVVERTVRRWVAKWKENEPLLKSGMAFIGLSLIAGLEHLSNNLDGIMEYFMGLFEK